MKTTRTLENPLAEHTRARRAARILRAPHLAGPALILLAGLLLLALVTLDALLQPYLAGDLTARVLSWGVAALRLPLGLAYVLIIPGYLLQALLFPRRLDLDPVGRLGLSIGLSIALVSLLVLLLDRLPWGLRSWPILIAQSLLVLLLLLAVLLRRLSLPPGVTFAPGLRLHPSAWWRSLSRLDRRIYALAGAALLLAAFATVWVFLTPDPAGYLTEFYMLGSGGLAEDYPRAARPGEALSVTLGIANHERGPYTYYIEIWQRDPYSGEAHLLERTPPFELDAGEAREWSQPWQPRSTGSDQQIEFLLFTAADPEPYRRLLLWLDIIP